MTETQSIASLNVLSSLRLISALKRSGAQDIVVSSGSRCAPLVLAVARCPDLRVLTHPDERSAGFLALGIAKATRRPAVLICTSGTAAANYLPSVVEARLSHTPLIVLTADRPPELRGTGAPQTIDQVALYGKYPLYFADLPTPGADGSDPMEWEQQAMRAVALAQGNPPGPVHLNLPFREPLIPDPTDLAGIFAAFSEEERARGGSPSNVGRSDSIEPTSRPEVWELVASKLAAAKRGLIICGPQNSCDDLGTAVSELAAAACCPILADVASQVRFGVHPRHSVLSHFDLCLRDRTFAASMTPDLVIRLGGLPTSKTLNEWLVAAPQTDHIIIDQYAELADPYRLGTMKLTADLTSSCTEIASCLRPKAAGSDVYLRRWQQAEQEAISALRSRRNEPSEIFEGNVVGSVFRLAPPGTGIFLSNSLPIRWAEFYASGNATPLRVFCNRGANGIDGIVSTAAGVASALNKTTVLVIGDIALIHDLNGLLPVQRHNLPLKIVLLNNDGGGIFSFLPIAAHEGICEPLVAMPHGRDFRHLAEFMGIRHRYLETGAAFDAAFEACLLQAGLEILEVRTKRDRNLTEARAIDSLVAARLGSVS